MPGFRADMIPALQLDYTEVNRRVTLLKALLDRAEGADFCFDAPAGACALHLDLRHRTAHASGGLLPKPGMADNLPSGEAYIMPYEGEAAGDPSRSEGVMPVQFGAEFVRYRIQANRAVAVLSEGPKSREEAALLAGEPAYGNLAELGLGVLAAFGVKLGGSAPAGRGHRRIDAGWRLRVGVLTGNAANHGPVYAAPEKGKLKSGVPWFSGKD